MPRATGIDFATVFTKELLVRCLVVVGRVEIVRNGSVRHVRSRLGARHPPWFAPFALRSRSSVCLRYTLLANAVRPFTPRPPPKALTISPPPDITTPRSPSIFIITIITSFIALVFAPSFGYDVRRLTTFPVVVAVANSFQSVQ